MTREEAIKVLRKTYCGNEAICELYRIDLCRTTDCEIYHAIKALEAEPYIEFCEWVADTVLYEDFEDKWTLGSFAEVACRKLHKFGFIRKDGEYWTKGEVENDTK